MESVKVVRCSCSKGVLTDAWKAVRAGSFLLWLWWRRWSRRGSLSRLMWSPATGEEGGGGVSVGMPVSYGQYWFDDELMLRSRGWTHCRRTWKRLSSRCERRPAVDEDDDASS
jgi:hypothetical protein